MQLSFRAGACFTDKNKAVSKKIKTKEEIMSDKQRQKQKDQQWRKLKRQRKDQPKQKLKHKWQQYQLQNGQNIILKFIERKNDYLCIFDSLFQFTTTTCIIFVRNITDVYMLVVFSKPGSLVDSVKKKSLYDTQSS